MKVHVTLRAWRYRWLAGHRWQVEITDCETDCTDHTIHAYTISSTQLNKATGRMLKWVREGVPKYTRLSYEYEPCPGDGCDGCGGCWDV